MVVLPLLLCIQLLLTHSLTQQEIKKQFAKEEAKFKELDVQKKGVPC